MAMPPGAWCNPVGAAVYQQQPAGRFAGHFMPHRLCHHFTNHGWCRKEEACTFAHGPMELHPRAAAAAGLAQPQMAVAPVVAKARPALYAGGGFTFNADAPTFEPSLEAAPAAAAGEAPQGGEEGPPGDQPPRPSSSSRSPSRRVPPAPLTLDEPGSPSGRAATAPLAPAQTTPLARRTLVAPAAGSPSASAMPRQQVLYSPKHVQLSPSSGASMASTMASATLLTSPMAVPLKGPLWPSSPVVASPQVAIPRDMLLQARTVVQRAEQGPPGLATCAPTPTTKAKNFGFRYPQPGWIVTGPTQAVMVQARR